MSYFAHDDWPSSEGFLLAMRLDHFRYSGTMPTLSQRLSYIRAGLPR